MSLATLPLVPMDRRDFLRTSGVLAASSLVPVDLRAAQMSGGGARAGDEDALDAALTVLRRAEPGCRLGLSTHAPMVAEALSALGRAERAVELVEAYRGALVPLPSASRRIDSENWRAALGPAYGVSSWTEANGRWGDWREYFERELDARPWRDVLDLWAGRLAPGLSGGATHGVIRTSHAVRALSRRENATRRGELARSLAYWASSYEEMPVGPRLGPPHRSFVDALAEVPLYWSAFGRQPGGRDIVEQLRHLRELERFGESRWMFTEPADPLAALSALTATFSRVYLRHGSQRHTIPFIHAITGPAALRRLSPHIRPETARAAFPHAWQAAAAIYSAYARSEDKPGSEEAKRPLGQLVDDAVRSGDDHAIKFTEVMLAEHASNPDPIYLAAAENAMARLTG